MIASIIFLIFFFCLAVFRLQWALRLLVILLPTYLIRFAIFSLPFTLLEGMILLLFSVWIGRVIVFRERRLLIFPWKWVIIVFLIAATISVFVSPELRAGLGLWKAYFIEPVLLFLVIVNTAKSREDKKWLITALGLSAVFVSLYAAGQYAGLLSSPEPWSSETPRRVSSVFDYPNAVGLYLAPLIALFAGFLAFKRPPVNRIFSVLIVVTGIAALVFSFTRGAWLGLAAVLLFLGLVSERKKLIWLILLVCLAGTLIFPATRDLAFSIFNQSDTSTDVRLVLWQGTWNLLKAHPWLGAGLSGFPALYDKYRLIKHTELLLYPHNIFLNFWAEIGLVGLLAFIGILISFFRAGVRAIQMEKSRVCAYALMSAMISLVIYGLVEAPYFKNDLSAQFWILCALMVVTQMRFDPDNKLSPEAAERLKKMRPQVER